MKKIAFALFLLCGSLAFSQSGTLTTYFTTWNGLTREYLIYAPPVLQNPPAGVFVLHGTTIALLSAPPLGVEHNMGWDQLADANGFLVIAAIGTWKPDKAHPGEFFWEAIGTENDFAVNPDDSGLLANLALYIQQTYGVDTGRTFAMGFSSGAMMAQRLCIEHADIFAACAALSGPIFAGAPPASMPLPSQPVSILEMHGDTDPTIPYCGGSFFGWGEGKIPMPSVDVDVDYWLAANGLPANPSALCSNGAPTPNVFRLPPLSANGVEVQFVREIGFGHTYKQATIAAVWEFFSTHGR